MKQLLIIAALLLAGACSPEPQPLNTFNQYSPSFFAGNDTFFYTQVSFDNEVGHYKHSENGCWEFGEEHVHSPRFGDVVGHWPNSQHYFVADSVSADYGFSLYHVSAHEVRVQFYHDGESYIHTYYAP